MLEDYKDNHHSMSRDKSAVAEHTSVISFVIKGQSDTLFHAIIIRLGVHQSSYTSPTASISDNSVCIRTFDICAIGHYREAMKWINKLTIAGKSFIDSLPLLVFRRNYRILQPHFLTIERE